MDRELLADHVRRARIYYRAARQIVVENNYRASCPPIPVPAGINGFAWVAMLEVAIMKAHGQPYCGDKIGALPIQLRPRHRHAFHPKLPK